MTLYIADSNVRDKATQLSNNLGEIADICQELGQVLESVTMKGGGLDSSLMRDAMQERARESASLARAIEALQNQVQAEASYYLKEIERIDQYLY